MKCLFILRILFDDIIVVIFYNQITFIKINFNNFIRNFVSSNEHENHWDQFLLCNQGMIECQQLGLTRSIGVSNFNERQLQRLLETSTIRPVNCQVIMIIGQQVEKLKTTQIFIKFVTNFSQIFIKFVTANQVQLYNNNNAPLYNSIIIIIQYIYYASKWIMCRN